MYFEWTVVVHSTDPGAACVALNLDHYLTVRQRTRISLPQILLFKKLIQIVATHSVTGG